MKLTNAPLALAVLLLAAACGQNKAESTTSKPTAEPTDTGGGKRVAIEANDKGFTPSSVTLTKGERTTLVFKRTSDGTCATEVVFPELKIEKKLPLNEAVAFEVPTDQSRTLGFQCGMGMYKSKIVVQLAAGARPDRGPPRGPQRAARRPGGLGAQRPRAEGAGPQLGQRTLAGSSPSVSVRTQSESFEPLSAMV
jgi:Cupredoxin-like domain